MLFLVSRRPRKRYEQPAFMVYLRSMFALRYSFGYLICTFPCGIVAGLAPLWESEGDTAVCWALNDIWRWLQHTPQLMFYDRGCDSRPYLRNHPELLWAYCIMLIDRYVRYLYICNIRILVICLGRQNPLFLGVFVRVSNIYRSHLHVACSWIPYPDPYRRGVRLTLVLRLRFATFQRTHSSLRFHFPGQTQSGLPRVLLPRKNPRPPHLEGGREGSACLYVEQFTGRVFE